MIKKLTIYSQSQFAFRGTQGPFQPADHPGYGSSAGRWTTLFQPPNGQPSAPPVPAPASTVLSKRCMSFPVSTVERQARFFRFVGVWVDLLQKVLFIQMALAIL